MYVEQVTLHNITSCRILWHAAHKLGDGDEECQGDCVENEIIIGKEGHASSWKYLAKGRNLVVGYPTSSFLRKRRLL